MVFICVILFANEKQTGKINIMKYFFNFKTF